MEEPRFAVDGMLEKLGSYLRCLGYDARFDPGASTATRIERANREGRVFLTRNRHLRHHAPLPVHPLAVAAEDPVEQLREVVAALGLGTERSFSRCIRCNVPLADLAREAARGRVPERVFACYEHFTTCPSCGTVFWKGTHVRNTCLKLGLPDASSAPPEAGRGPRRG